MSAEVARRLDRRAVLIVGRHDENRPSFTDPNILVADHARHDAIFPRAAVVIHQGGAGTLHQAMRSGRQMLVVPYAHDQPDNACRVRRLGVSRTLKPSAYRPDRVQRELGRLLDDPSYRQNAERVAEVVQAESGAEGAAQAIGDLIC